MNTRSSGTIATVSAEFSRFARALFKPLRISFVISSMISVDIAISASDEAAAWEPAVTPAVITLIISKS